MEFMKKIALLIVSLTFIAGCATITYPPPETKRDGVYHKVNKNETLWNIAKAYNVTLKSIVDSNRMPDANTIKVGQLIFIPGRKERGRVDIKAISSKYENFVWPVKGKIISRFNSLKNASRNKGIDISAPYKQNVVASRSGKVSFCTDSMEGYGRTIIIDHNDGYQTVYAYNSINLVKEGEYVKQNQLIARVGRSGRAVGPSLHFEIRKRHDPQNPFYYLP